MENITKRGCPPLVQSTETSRGYSLGQMEHCASYVDEAYALSKMSELCIKSEKTVTPRHADYSTTVPEPGDHSYVNVFRRLTRHMWLHTGFKPFSCTTLQMPKLSILSVQERHDYQTHRKFFTTS